MSFELLYTGPFGREFKRLNKKYSSLKNDFKKVVKELTENPTLGTPFGRDSYKIRFAIASKNKGKSGGGRIVIHIHLAAGEIYFLSIYGKSDRDNLSLKELRSLLDFDSIDS